MRPLFDGDILLYELGFAAETAWKHKLAAVGRVSDDPPPFDFVYEMLENKIGNICAIVGATKPPEFFFTGKGNFRTDIAFTEPYKARIGNRPFHYANIKACLLGERLCHQVDGLEADDLIAIEMGRSDDCICCTRDKDLRHVDGWHYGWELGNQPEFGPILVEGWGSIILSPKRNKINGWGEQWFWCQMLLGDSVDTIPGIPKCGPVCAYEHLSRVNNTVDAFKVVSDCYKACYGLYWPEVMLEQGRLLHMTRKLHPDGSPILWEFPV